MTVIFCVTNNTHCTFLKYYGTMNDFCSYFPKQAVRKRNASESMSDIMSSSNL